MSINISLRARLRKRLRKALDRSLAAMFTAVRSNQLIPKQPLHRILVVRTNHRIGNLLFLTPLLQALHELLPDCQIDLVISLQPVQGLLQPLPGLGEIYVLPKPSIKKLAAVVRRIRQMRQVQYDLVIDPNGKSASGRLVLALLNSSRKLGFQIEGSWSPLTHSIALPRQALHEARRPLILLQAIEGHRHFTSKATLALALNREEKHFGATHLRQLLASDPCDSIKRPTIGLFRLARRDKKIPDQWWRDWIAELQHIAANIQIVEVLAPDVSVPLIEGCPCMQMADLRQLAAVLSQLDAFVCADTGPMHLASAAGTPTIALFNATTADIYGPQGANDLVLQQNQLSIPELAAAVVRHLQQLGAIQPETRADPARGMCL